jgi:hypothetical protein
MSRSQGVTDAWTSGDTQAVVLIDGGAKLTSSEKDRSLTVTAQQ